MTDPTETERVRLATAGARAVTLESLSSQPRGDLFKGALFYALLILALAVALAGLGHCRPLLGERVVLVDFGHVRLRPPTGPAFP